MARKKDINLEGRLVLHAWANELFGYGDTREMLSDLERADEGFDGGGGDDPLALNLFRGIPMLAPDEFLSELPGQKPEQEARRP